MDVRHLGPMCVDKGFSDRGDSRVAIRLVEASDGAECVVDPRDLQAGSFFVTDAVLGARRIGLSGQDLHLIANTCQRTRVLVHIDLAAALSVGRKAVDDYQDPHQTPSKRSGFQPLAAESPPRYCPKDHATASATARGVPIAPPPFRAA